MGHCRFTIMRNNKRATSEKKTPGVAVSGGSSPVTDENLLITHYSPSLVVPTKPNQAVGYLRH